ncbi:MAG TPA: dihydrolipoamide acetyltransferase family protein [Conexibacter sp.]|jgi:pyruvate dehydrogenase E2 component (dihydrolipoamide acetyltransferase)|nr:dihydrolipoamide acetyltransferase family protein [Conexibacter sp.]
MTTIAMPRLSDSMEEGTILQWLVEHGAEVREGEDLIEVETDKATITHPAQAGGVVHHVVVAGETIAVGAPIAHILAAGESAPDAGEAALAAAVIAPAASEAGPASGEPAHAAASAAPASGEPARSATPVAADGQPPDARVKASPLARRVARELGVPLETVRGSGPNGRVVRADVQAAATAVTAQTASGNGAAPAAATVVELTRMQQTIARRMSEAKATIPDFQVRTEVDVTELVELRGRLKAASVATSVNDFVVRACAVALTRHPRANGSFRDGAFQLHAAVNVGVAVAGPDLLVVPVIRDADRKPIVQIGEETRTLAGRVREGTITPPELAGGTFTVSNLGMFGVTSFTAVVNPGQAAILAVGAARERLALAGGQVQARQALELSLSCDHRILYGADAAAFLADVRGLLEAPLTLLT